MTLDEQRIAICTLLGWTYDERLGAVFFAKDGDILGFDWPSLDACHEFEKMLSGKFGEQELYWEHLLVIAGLPPKTVHATAAQRCEAFLRTVGKWKEKE